MISGMRHSVDGMTQRAAAQEVVANNLANISTAGYKAERITFAEVLKQATPAASTTPTSTAAAAAKPAAGTPLNAGASAASAARTGLAATRPGTPSGAPAPETRTIMTTNIDLRPGSVQATGNDNDLAIDGPGFFTVQGEEGELYTRGGSFTLNGQGQLVTREGYPLLTEGGPITAENGKVMVSADGMVSVNGTPVGKLKLATFEQPADLKRESAGLFSAVGEPQAEANVRVAQGYLEDANVKPVEMLTEMIDTMRSFESNQKALAEQLDTQEKLVAEAAK